MTESGVCLIKKKVASLKSELDECQVRASEAEETLADKETIIEKVHFDYFLLMPYISFSCFFHFCFHFCVTVNVM